jgi:hypothetical protein
VLIKGASGTSHESHKLQSNTEAENGIDFADLLFESNSQDQRIIGTAEADGLNNLFGDSFFEGIDANEPDLEFEGLTAWLWQKCKTE